MSAAQVQVCPVIGATTTVLPPGHPEYNASDKEARCPVTNAQVGHHGSNVIHNHPSAPSVPAESSDASKCPAMKGMESKDALAQDICPIVGSVTTVLPPSHPSVDAAEEGAVCPITKASLAHHKKKVHVHPSVASDASQSECPVAGSVAGA
ncbi:Hypothetical protein R9X50_00712900 [Acrodontium crateriforme]|uniref:Uncharacterized protein n=1 Tax=Acrodontium crateriforme TaxID=150365 RepID=A0AAQ3MAH3_9PEZI|nr:Hypothetical protein R9X50_00712900 [Acrodontium crateriforme]